jgi:hypothetical protein
MERQTCRALQPRNPLVQAAMPSSATRFVPCNSVLVRVSNRVGQPRNLRRYFDSNFRPAFRLSQLSSVLNTRK